LNIFKHAVDFLNGWKFLISKITAFVYEINPGRELAEYLKKD
jgi:hypothetical protein